MSKAVPSLLAAALLAAVVAFSRAAGAEYNDAIAAVVGERVITVSDVVAQTRAQELLLARSHAGDDLYQRVEVLRRFAARRMIENELVHLEFKDKGYTLPAEYLQKRIDGVVVAQAGGSRERLEQKLADDGYTFAEFEEEIARQAAAELLLDEMVRRRVHISPLLVRQYYQENPAEFSRAGRVHLQMIFLKADGRYAGQLDETVRRIQEQIAEKADFAWLARQYSEGPAADAGGDLGWQDEKDVREEFAAALRPLAPGEVAPPVATPDGIAILRLQERETAGLLPLDDALARRIGAQLRAAEEEKRYREYIDGLTRKFHVRIFTDTTDDR
jgi:parvulin-like peptidyl-prolyl isomerase